MSIAAKRSKRSGPGRVLLRFHRRIGIALSAIFIVICATGILLNHSSDLDFNRKLVSAEWLYDWYDIEPEGEIIHFEFGGAQLSSLDGHLYFNTEPVYEIEAPIGIAVLSDLIAVATPQSILLLSHSGAIIELIESNALPEGEIQGIQNNHNSAITIKTSQGVYRSDQAILEWTPSSWDDTAPAILTTPPSEKTKQSILNSFRGEGLTWGRILLDIHSGRFFGPIGKWIVDLAALGLIILTLSGILYTLKYLKNPATPSPNQPIHFTKRRF